MRSRGSPSGPVVILGSADSIFVGQMAGFFVDRGWPVKVVSMQPRGGTIPDSVEYVFAGRRSWLERACFRGIRPLAHWLQETWMRRNLPHFRRATGKEHPDLWEWAVWDQLEHARQLSKIAMSFRPRLVIGQEIAGYGVPTAMCRGVPRVLQPWGSDIFLTPESWPGAERVIAYAVRRADLLIPSSATAAVHLVRRFQVDPQNIMGLSLGIDTQLVSETSSETRGEVCRQWGLAPQSVFVQNCRRFRRQWGSEQSLEAFLNVAGTRPEAHFIILGGADGVEEIDTARRRISTAGLSHRFTIIDRRLTLEEYNQLSRITDIAVSLMSWGDMRSASVLTLAARGAAQVIAEHPEYRAMTTDGFQATFVDQHAPNAIQHAIESYIDSPDRRRLEGQANRHYIMQFEDRSRNVERVMQRIDEVCRDYYRRADRVPAS